jgi:hypothetical protein
LKEDSEPFCAQFMKKISDDPIEYLIQKEKDDIENVIKTAAMGGQKEKKFSQPFFEVNKKWLSLLNFKIKEKSHSDFRGDIGYTITISWG